MKLRKERDVKVTISKYPPKFLSSPLPLVPARLMSSLCCAHSSRLRGQRRERLSGERDDSAAK